MVAVAATAFIATTITCLVRYRKKKRSIKETPSGRTTGRRRILWPLKSTSKPDVEKAVGNNLSGRISAPSNFRELDSQEKLIVETSDKRTYAQTQRNEAESSRSRVFGVVERSGRGDGGASGVADARIYQHERWIRGAS